MGKEIKREGESTTDASSHSEKDIEAGYSVDGRVSSSSNDSSSMSSDSHSDYDEGIRRITTLDDPGNDGGGVIKTISTKTSRTSKDLEAILNTQFEVKWDGPKDPDNPMNWPLTKKGIILALVSMQTLMVYVYSIYNVLRTN
jgi:hypothetical protein